MYFLNTGKLEKIQKELHGFILTGKIDKNEIELENWINLIVLYIWLNT